jgi:hypothetical protein
MSDCPLSGVYSFKHVVVTIDGAQVFGFADDDAAVSIEPFVDDGIPVVGADGTAMVSLSASQAVYFRVKLMPISPFNRLFENKRKRYSAGVVTPMTVGFIDTTTGERAGCTGATITKRSTIQHGGTVQEREWEIFCPCWVSGEVTYNQ